MENLRFMNIDTKYNNIGQNCPVGIQQICSSKFFILSQQALIKDMTVILPFFCISFYLYSTNIITMKICIHLLKKKRKDIANYMTIYI